MSFFPVILQIKAGLMSVVKVLFFCEFYYEWMLSPLGLYLTLYSEDRKMASVKID